jgi:hypothetical protein
MRPMLLIARVDLPQGTASVHASTSAGGDNAGGQWNARQMLSLEKEIRRNTLKVTFRDSLNQTAHTSVQNEEEAKTVARFLFFNILHSQVGGEHAAPATAPADGKPALVPADLEPLLPVADIPGAFAMLDDDGDGAATAADCEAAVLKIMLERRNLAASLEDARSIVAAVEVLFAVVIHIVFIFL